MRSEDLARRLLTLKASFAAVYGSDPAYVVRAPGRVNLIGEHTDYNDGFVFPAAIDREMLIAATPNENLEDLTVTAYSQDYREQTRFSIDRIESSEEHRWSNYLRGTLAILRDAGYRMRGFKAALSGNVPQGAGLSSSAAYEVAVATLVKTICDLAIEPKQIALLSQKAENEFIGVKCGIMDQFISALGQPDSALMIDCRSLTYKSVPLRLSKHGLSIVITNSGVQRGLVDSEYNARRSECQQGVKLLAELLNKPGIEALRDVSLEEFLSVEDKLPEVVTKRCRHVISENQRVLDAVAALEKGDTARFGQLMNASHESLMKDFQVSCPELDQLVALTQAHKGVIGARMTGAGFGGCTVAIMDSGSVAEFKEKVVPEYEKQSGKNAEVYVCSAVGGANVIESIVRI